MAIEKILFRKKSDWPTPNTSIKNYTIISTTITHGNNKLH